jgi:tetratricopeptide (TPR) repeat protein
MAKEYFEKAIEINLLSYPTRKDGLAMVYANLASYYAYTGKFEKAEHQFNTALDITLELYGNMHVDTGILYNKFVTMYRLKGDRKNGRAFAQKAIPILKIHISANNLDKVVKRRFEENLKWLKMTYN